eukprot:scaffold16967_cov113-Isochrysis_galbana.AAC.9
MKCACFGAGELNPPLPPREGDCRVWGRKHNNPHVIKSNDRSTDRRHRRNGSPTLLTRLAPSATHLATATPEACLPTRHSPPTHQPSK